MLFSQYEGYIKRVVSSSHDMTNDTGKIWGLRGEVVRLLAFHLLGREYESQ